MIKSVFLCVGVFSLALAGCSKSDSKVAPLPDPVAKVEANNGDTTIRVLETMNSGGYTYARLQVAGGERWVAGPETTLAVGDEVVVGQGSTMRDFHSNTLDRTFESIHFVSSLARAGAGAPAAGAGAPAAGAGAPAAGGAHPTPAKPAAPVKVGKLEPVKGGTSIDKVFAGKDKLSGKPVVVRGTVVKYNSGIMGKNWLHIQDGSGDAASKTNDLTVTTDATAKVGDIVVVRGTLATSKDFGGGYSYDVIVEDAAITVE